MYISSKSTHNIIGDFMGNSDSRLALNEGLSSFAASKQNTEADIRSLCSIPVRIEDVFEIVTPDFVRVLRRDEPGKLVQFLGVLVSSVYEVYDKSVKIPVVGEEDLTRLSSCVRFLSRLVPFINDESECDEFERQLWRAGGVPKCIDDVDPESIGYRLIGCLMRLAFIRGYSISGSCPVPSTVVDPSRVDSTLVWGRGGGVGGLGLSRSTWPISAQIVSNRDEVLRLFILVLSRPLFMSLSEYKTKVPILNTLVISGDFIHTSNLFVSLLLTVLEHKTSHFAIPILSNSLADESGSPEESVVTSALQLLTILVDPPGSGNVFREILRSGLTEKEEAEFIVSRVGDKLRSIFEENSSFKFSINSKLRNWNPFVLFLFQLVSVNSAVLDQLARSSVGADLMRALLFLVASPEPANAGLVHTAGFLLLTLSGHREFVLAVMNRNDGLIDFYVQLVCKLASKAPESLLEMLLTVLCNMAPFVGGFSRDSATAMLALLERTSRPAWMLAQPHRHHAVQFLLESVNSALHYQYEGNSALVYALLLPVGKKILANVESLTSIGPNVSSNYQPSAEWVQETKRALPVETIARLVSHLGPRIEEECRLNEGNIDHTQVLDLVRRISLVGILPVPHAIVVRQYQPNEQTRLWFTSYLWGTVFTLLQPFPLIDSSRVRIVTLSVRGSGQQAADPQPESPSQPPTDQGPFDQQASASHGS